MEYSPKYHFYLPSRDTDDLADINEISANFRLIDAEMLSLDDVQDFYNPATVYPQSGIAVAEAISTKSDIVTSTWLASSDPSNYQNKIVQCSTTGNGYTQGYFYISQQVNGTWTWVQLNVQPGGIGAVVSVNGKTGVVVLSPSDLGIADFTNQEIDDIWDEVFE